MIIISESANVTIDVVNTESASIIACDELSRDLLEAIELCAESDSAIPLWNCYSMEQLQEYWSSFKYNSNPLDHVRHFLVSRAMYLMIHQEILELEDLMGGISAEYGYDYEDYGDHGLWIEIVPFNSSVTNTSIEMSTPYEAYGFIQGVKTQVRLQNAVSALNNNGEEALLCCH